MTSGEVIKLKTSGIGIIPMANHRTGDLIRTAAVLMAACLSIGWGGS
jgi:hypothetical protein